MIDRENDLPGSADLGIAWTWEYDAPFVHAVREACVTHGVTLLEVTKQNIEQVTRAVLDGTLRFGWYFDRASDEDDAFRTLSSFLLKRHRSGERGHTRFVNPSDDARRAADKATMHLEFITHGIHVPHTVILSSFSDQPEIDFSEGEMKQLGVPFVVKPANTTGGGAGVIMDAKATKDVIRHRMTYEQDKYLLQRKVNPVYLSETRAWFRVFYAFGDTWLCWWDDQTHVYDEVTRDEERWFGLHELRSSIRTIATICRLDFFSSEFAQVADETFVSVDYVNELCDMRPKSTAPDGVPDALVAWVAERLAGCASGRIANRIDKGLDA